MGLLSAILFAIALAGVYTSFPFVVGAGKIPAGFAAFAGLALAFVSGVSPGGAKRFGGVAVAVAGLALAWSATIPFSPDPVRFLKEHLISVGFLCFSVTAAWGVFNYARSLRTEQLSKLFGSLAVALLALATLERYTPFVEVSNAVRAVLYSGSFLYESGDRDIEIAGAVRPMVFTQEPSHLAKFLMASILVWAFTRRGRSLWPPLGAFVVALFITGSPTVVIGLAILTIVIGADYADRFAQFNRSGVGKTLGRGVVFILALLMMYVYANFADISAFLPFERAQLIAGGKDASSVIRMSGAYSLAWAVLEQYPISGAGIGGRELVQGILLEIYNSYGLKMERFYGSEGYTGWGNAFTEIIVYGGAVIGALVYTVQFAVMRIFIPRLSLLIPIFFLVFNMDSGFTSPRVWVYFALISAGLTVRYRTSRADEMPAW